MNIVRKRGRRSQKEQVNSGAQNCSDENILPEELKTHPLQHGIQHSDLNKPLLVRLQAILSSKSCENQTFTSVKDVTENNATNVKVEKAEQLDMMETGKLNEPNANENVTIIPSSAENNGNENLFNLSKDNSMQLDISKADNSSRCEMESSCNMDRAFILNTSVASCNHEQTDVLKEPSDCQKQIPFTACTVTNDFEVTKEYPLDDSDTSVADRNSERAENNNSVLECDKSDVVRADAEVKECKDVDLTNNNKSTTPEPTAKKRKREKEFGMMSKKRRVSIEGEASLSITFIPNVDLEKEDVDIDFHVQCENPRSASSLPTSNIVDTPKHCKPQQATGVEDTLQEKKTKSETDEHDVKETSVNPPAESASSKTDKEIIGGPNIMSLPTPDTEQDGHTYKLCFPLQTTLDSLNLPFDEVDDKCMPSNLPSDLAVPSKKRRGRPKGRQSNIFVKDIPDEENNKDKAEIPYFRIEEKAEPSFSKFEEEMSLFGTSECVTESSCTDTGTEAPSIANSTSYVSIKRKRSRGNKQESLTSLEEALGDDKATSSQLQSDGNSLITVETLELPFDEKESMNEQKQQGALITSRRGRKPKIKAQMEPSDISIENLQLPFDDIASQPQTTPEESRLKTKKRKGRRSSDFEVLSLVQVLSPETSNSPGTETYMPMGQPSVRRSRRIKRKSLEIYRAANRKKESEESLDEDVCEEATKGATEGLSENCCRPSEQKLFELSDLAEVTNIPHDEDSLVVEIKVDKKPEKGPSEEPSMTRRVRKKNVQKKPSEEQEKTAPKPAHSKKGKAKRKYEEAIEDIYLNKLWRTQMPKDKTWETIFEEPKQNYQSTKKYKVKINFDDFYAKNRLKKRRQKALKHGWKPFTVKQDKKASAMLDKKLASLEEALCQVSEEETLEGVDEHPFPQDPSSDYPQNVQDDISSSLTSSQKHDEDIFYTPRKSLLDIVKNADFEDYHDCRAKPETDNMSVSSTSSSVSDSQLYKTPLRDLLEEEDEEV